MAAALGVSRSAYASYESGAARAPDSVMKAARKEATAKGVKLSSGDVTTASDHQLVEGMSVMVAIRSWRGALAGSDANDEEPFVQEEYPAEMPSAFLIGGVRSLDRHELLRVVGFSMAPRIMPGERVLVYIDSVPRVGAIVMAESPTRSVYLKVLRRKHERFWLESINPKGPQDIPLDGWKIHGYAIAIMGDPGSTESGRNIEWAFGQPLRA